MAQFKDKFRVSILIDTIKFSITINDFYVIEHQVEIESIILFIQNWNNDSFENENIKAKKLKDDFYQLSIKDNNTKHVYRLSNADFSRMFARLRRSGILESLRGG